LVLLRRVTIFEPHPFPDAGQGERGEEVRQSSGSESVCVGFNHSLAILQKNPDGLFWNAVYPVNN
jgi:hypothetical protein